MDISLGERELDVLGVLWDGGPGTVPDVRERLAASLNADLAYNTVLTILRNLEAKGVVSHHADGRFHRYFAVVDKTRVQQRQLDRLVDKLYLGSPLSLMTHLVSGDALSSDDVRALTELLNARLAQADGDSGDGGAV